MDREKRLRMTFQRSRLEPQSGEKVERTSSPYNFIPCSALVRSFLPSIYFLPTIPFISLANVLSFFLISLMSEWHALLLYVCQYTSGGCLSCASNVYSFIGRFPSNS